MSEIDYGARQDEPGPAILSGTQVLSFVVILIGISWAGQLLALRVTGGVDRLGDSYAFIWIMFTPALCTVAFLAIRKEYRRYVQWSHGSVSLLLAAPLIPVLLGFAIIGIVAGLGWGQSEYFDFGRAGVGIASGPWLLGTGEQNWLTFAVNVVLTTIAYAVMSSLATVGEELGWRGFLQPVLIEKLGTTPGIAVLGLVWALWHLPIMLAGYNYPEHPILGALLLFPALLVGASFLLAWITIRAGSLWPAVLLHGSINSVYHAMIGDKLILNVPRLQVDTLEITIFAVVALLCRAVLVRTTRSD
jgi:membrane protease YdiL (CAAX protease family)